MVVGSALVIVMMLGSMCAYVLARFDFFGARAIYYLMLAGLTFPVFLAIVPLFFVLKSIGLLNTLPGLTLTYVAFALPFTVFFLYPFFKDLPDEIAEAAEVDGAGEWRKFFQIMLPMARPGMASVAIFNFLGLWNQFLLPVALNTNRDNYVLSQGMASFASQANYAVDFGALFAAVVITVVPVLIVYLIFQRQLQGSVSAGHDEVVQPSHRREGPSLDGPSLRLSAPGTALQGVRTCVGDGERSGSAGSGVRVEPSAGEEGAGRVLVLEVGACHPGGEAPDVGDDLVHARLGALVVVHHPDELGLGGPLPGAVEGGEATAQGRDVGLDALGEPVDVAGGSGDDLGVDDRAGHGGSFGSGRPV